jgi:hypothetical protein
METAPRTYKPDLSPWEIAGIGIAGAWTQFVLYVIPALVVTGVLG